MQKRFSRSLGISEKQMPRGNWMGTSLTSRRSVEDKARGAGEVGDLQMQVWGPWGGGVVPIKASVLTKRENLS